MNCSSEAFSKPMGSSLECVSEAPPATCSDKKLESPFKILSNAPIQSPSTSAIRPSDIAPMETVLTRSDGVKILPDGSEQLGSLVHLKIFGSELWYDLESHNLVRWHHGQRPDADGESSLIHDFEDTAASTAKKTYAVKAVRYDTGAERTIINCVELHVNDKCNFRCDYCYLKSAGIEYLDNEMPREVAIKAVHFLLERVPSGSAGVIKFYGGEPFLSYGLMKHVVDHAEQLAKAQGKRMEFTINTNGSLLNDDKIEWVKQHKIRVTISIDGNKASNDKFRKFISGNGTFATVIRKAKLFLEKAGYLNLRSTITDGSFELKDSVLELGAIGDSKKVKVLTECNFVGDTKVDQAGADNLMREAEELAQLFVDKTKSGEKLPYGNFIEPMFKIFHNVKSPYRCGAARTMVAVSPKGTLYPCHRFVDVQPMDMGNVDQGLNGQHLEDFRMNRVEFKKPCSDCWARYFCGGGCAFNNYFTNARIEDPNNVHCKLFRHQVKLGLWIYSHLPELHRSKQESGGCVECTGAATGR